jgi:hypothetical protein
VLSLPYVEEYDETYDERLEGSVLVNTKSRSLFKARVFEWRGSARGEFGFDGTFEPVRYRSDSRIAWGRPAISLMVADPPAKGATTPSRQAPTSERPFASAC